MIKIHGELKLDALNNVMTHLICGQVKEARDLAMIILNDDLAGMMHHYADTWDEFPQEALNYLEALCDTTLTKLWSALELDARHESCEDAEANLEKIKEWLGYAEDPVNFIDEILEAEEN